MWTAINEDDFQVSLDQITVHRASEGNRFKLTLDPFVFSQLPATARTTFEKCIEQALFLRRYGEAGKHALLQRYILGITREPYPRACKPTTDLYDKAMNHFGVRYTFCLAYLLDECITILFDEDLLKPTDVVEMHFSGESRILTFAWPFM